jgi:hypothetical protein
LVPDQAMRRRELLGIPTACSIPTRVECVRGEGEWLFDAEGHRDLDAAMFTCSAG